MNIKIFAIVLSFLTVSINSVKATDFSEKELIVEIKIDKDILKDVKKCNLIHFKLMPILNQNEVNEWIKNGKNHPNVESFKIISGNEKDGWEFELTFKNGLNYATGKELFSSALFIDFFILNGEKIATNRFVSQNLSHQ